MEVKKLGEILTESQLREVTGLIKENDLMGLRDYLNSIEQDLIKKGVLPDYLYYYIVHSFGLNS